MSKVVVETITAVLSIHVIYRDAREISKIETRVSKHAEIHQKSYLMLKDKNGVSRIRSALYIVSSQDPRTLKILLTKLNNHGKAEITF